MTNIISSQPDGQPQGPDLTRTAQLLGVLGCPTRLEVLCCVARGDICVCDLAGLMDLEASLISHHLRALRAARLVAVTQHGHRHIYSLGALVRLTTTDQDAALEITGTGVAIVLALEPVRAEVDAPLKSRVEIKPARRDRAGLDGAQGA